MSSPTKPVVLIIHGAYHRPAHFEELASILRRRGYDTEVPPLPSVGVTKDPGGALHKDAETVAQVLRVITSKGKDVVVFMHSYGGMAGSEGVAMFYEKRDETALSSSGSGQNGGRILRLVFCNAYALHQGDSWLAEHTLEKDPRIASFPTTVSEEGMITCLDPKGWYYTSTSPEKADVATGLLQPMAMSSFTEQSQYGGVNWARYRVPAVHYIGCKKDEMIPLSMQQDFVARMESAGTKISATWLDYDHSPFLDAAGEVVDLLLQGDEHK